MLQLSEIHQTTIDYPCVKPDPTVIENFVKKTVTKALASHWNHGFRDERCGAVLVEGLGG